MPKPRLHLFKNIIYNCPYASYNRVGKIIDIWSSDVMWKDKYDSPRHERDPFIWICFFKTFGFSINFKINYVDEEGKICDGGMYYWEYLLDFLYYRKDLTKWDKWENYYTKTITPTPKFSLKKEWLDANFNPLKSK